jgi:phage host-nuclease inhibitor protein Gam
VCLPDTFEYIHFTFIRNSIVHPPPFKQETLVMEYNREYIEKIAVRLDDLDREIGELEAIADKAVEEVKANYYKQIKQLFLKKEALQNKVTHLREGSGNAWEDMKAGTELSWEVFNDSVKREKKKPK